MWPDKFSSVRRTQRLEGKKRKKKEESLVKYKSADNYVGRPNDSNDCRQIKNVAYQLTA